MKRLIDFVAKHPVAITAAVCFVFYFMPFKPKLFGDGEYHEGTIQLINFILNGFQGDVRVDKGLLPLFYYIIPYSLGYVFHSNTIYYLFGVIFNSAVICLGVKYLFKSFDLLQFSNKSKFWTLAVLNLFPIHAYYAMGILAEAGSFFSVCMLIYLWIKITAKKSDSVVDFVLLASFSAMLIGFRPNMLPFALFFLIYVLVIKISLKHKLFFAGTLVFLIALMTFAEKSLSAGDGEFKKQVFRNQLLWSRFELRDDPFNWLPQDGQKEFATSDYLHNLAKRQELDSICDAGNLDKTTYYVKWVANDIIHNPVLTLRQYGLKFFQSQSFFISPMLKYNRNNWIKYTVHIYINGVNYILIFFSIGSVIILAREKKYQILEPLLLLWGWSLLYVFIFHSEQRYMFPMRPVLVFLFAYFVNHYYNGKHLHKVVS
jgi:hypothetical protein